jgi:hypothetical protein
MLAGRAHDIESELFSLAIATALLKRFVAIDRSRRRSGSIFQMVECCLVDGSFVVRLQNQRW